MRIDSYIKYCNNGITLASKPAFFFRKEENGHFVPEPSQRSSVCTYVCPSVMFLVKLYLLLNC